MLLYHLSFLQISKDYMIFYPESATRLHDMWDALSDHLITYAGNMHPLWQQVLGLKVDLSKLTEGFYYLFQSICNFAPDIISLKRRHLWTYSYLYNIYSRKGIICIEGQGSQSHQTLGRLLIGKTDKIKHGFSCKTHISQSLVQIRWEINRVSSW